MLWLEVILCPFAVQQPVKSGRVVAITEHTCFLGTRARKSVTGLRGLSPTRVNGQNFVKKSTCGRVLTSYDLWIVPGQCLHACGAIWKNLKFEAAPTPNSGFSTTKIVWHLLQALPQAQARTQQALPQQLPPVGTIGGASANSNTLQTLPRVEKNAYASIGAHHTPSPLTNPNKP